MKFLKELFTDSTTGRYSSSKFWFNAVSAAVLGVYIKVGVGITPENLGEAFTFFTLVVAGIVTGNKVANVITQRRMGVDVGGGIKDGTDSTPGRS